MADFMDVEDSIISPMTNSPSSARFRRNQLKIADGSKVVNAANEGIQINEQKVDIAAGAKEVTMNDHSKKSAQADVYNSTSNPVNLYINGGSQYDISRPFPLDDSAAFTHNYTSKYWPTQISNFRPTWNEMSDAFTDAREKLRQQEDAYILWHESQVTDAIHGVKDALLKFRQRWELKESTPKSPRWTTVKENIRQAGSKARIYYKQPYLLQDPMVDRIRNINSFLTGDDDLRFLGWLDRLPDAEHRHCLADPVRSILDAVLNCRPFNIYTVKCLEKVLSHFSNSSEYIRLCWERRPTANMPAATVDIFTQSAELFATLLDHSRLKSRQNGKYIAHIESAIDRLGRTLANINGDAIVKLRGGGRAERPRGYEDLPELLIRAGILNLCRDVPAVSQLRDCPYHTRRMSQIETDVRLRDLSTDLSSRGRQSSTMDTIDKKQVLDALSFRRSDNMKDIDECLRYAEISGGERSQLAVLTREDAFQDWLKEDNRSTALVIHGNLDDDENSPVSYLAAQIGQKHRNRRGYIVLSWFCGLHPDENGSALMARLTGQLLAQATPLLPPVDFDFVSRHEFKKLKQRDLDTLIGIFSSTIQKLRSKRIVVFCLIDSISTYEAANMKKDTAKLVKSLRHLVRLPRQRRRTEVQHELIFKVLISDGQSSELASEYFGKEILEMDDDVDTDVDSDASLVSSD